MRDPFQMTGDCTFVSVNVDIWNFIPTGLPFCTIPDFTEPTLVARMPEVLVPDIAMPDICRCLTFVVDKHVSFGEFTAPAFTFAINRSTADCCDLLYSVVFGLNVPCIPFGFTSESTAYLGSGLNLNIEIHPVVAETCMLMFSAGLEIPCFPLDVMAAGTIHVGSKFSIGIDFSRIAGPETCMLALNLDIQLPPMIGLTCGDLLVTNTVVVSHADDKNIPGDFKASLYFGENCTLHADYEIVFPYVLSGGDFTVTNFFKQIDFEGKFTLDIYFGDDCTLYYDYEMSHDRFTCADITPVRSDIVRHSPDWDGGDFDSTFYWGNNCTLHADYEIDFPRTLSCADFVFTAAGTRIGRGVVDNGTFNLIAWMGDDCTFHLSYYIDFPLGLGDDCDNLTVQLVKEYNEFYTFNMYFDDCVLKASYSLDVDGLSEEFCGLLTVNPLNVDVAGPGLFDVDLHFDEDCNLHASFKISFPDALDCSDLTVDPLVVNVEGPGLFTVDLHFDEDCNLYASFKISFPDEFGCANLGGGDWIYFGDDCTAYHECPGDDNFMVEILVDVSLCNATQIALRPGHLYLELDCGHPDAFYIVTQAWFTKSLT